MVKQGKAGSSQFSDDRETLPKHRHGIKDYFPIFCRMSIITAFAKAVITKNMETAPQVCYYLFRGNGNNQKGDMQQVPHIYQTLYSELAQRALDASFTTEFDIRGRFVAAEMKGRRYWYFDLPDGEGGKKRTYVGPVEDREITARVENFKDLKADIRERRKLVSTLVREAYLPRPEGRTGDIVQALAEAGFFRLRGVLVGTVAYQCYPAILGMRLPATSMATGDADFAQFHSISVAVEDAMPPVLQTLKAVDPSFREVPHRADGRFSTQYSSRSGYKVEFLTPNTGSDDHADQPMPMPALGGAAAQPLRFLDFLIYQPVRAVLLHGAGVPVNVPSPEKFAVHKLIVASRRLADNDGTAKSRKDRMQAANIMEAMVEQRRSEDIADAFMEAFERGPAWKTALRDSLSQIDERPRRSILEGLAAGVRKLDRNPDEFGLSP